MTCMAEKLRTYEEGLYTSADAFDGSYIEYATLHVPAASIPSYKSMEPWNAFGNIVALNDDDPKPTGILPHANGRITCPIDYYSIGGVKSSKPHRGLNIIRMDNGTTKKKYMR